MRALWLVISLAFTLTLSAAAPQVEEAARAPIVVPGVSNAVAAAVGNHTYFVLLNDGGVMSWGYNNLGQLGNAHTGPLAGSEPGKTMPFVVQGTAERIAGLSDVIAIAAGSEHALAVKRDGSVWGWGSNGDSQLALPKPNRGANPTPIRVPGVNGAVAVAAFDNASYALLQDGTVLGWGERLWRTGGRAVSSETPTPVPGLRDVAAIRAGLPCVALLRDGTLRTWGSGVPGNGSMSQRDYASTIVPQPATVSGIDDAVAIAAGANGAAAIRKDGSVWTWDEDHFLPAMMANLPRAVDVALGSGSSIVFADGTLRTWGDARLGATGRSGIERIKGPTPVAGVKDLVRVWSRAYGNLGLTRDGRILAWGSVFVAH